MNVLSVRMGVFPASHPFIETIRYEADVLLSHPLVLRFCGLAVLRSY